MAWSYPLDFPALTPRKMVPRLRRAQTRSESPFTFQEQIYSHPGHQFSFDLEFPPMVEADAKTLIAFLMKLRGRVGTFYFSPVENYMGSGVTGAVGSVSGSYNEEIAISGAATGTLLAGAGDWVSIDNVLQKAAADCTSDGSGNATLYVEPGLRSSTATAVRFSTARGIMRLASPDLSYDVGDMMIYGINIVIQEAI